ncbi:MAG: hypothetical protein FRX49_09229 [Trebouxia sp. A1-2]|nr:MAG: hypothetical protein FRX49_09229 [Trebouxia sp. A1-2]
MSASLRLFEDSSSWLTSVMHSGSWKCPLLELVPQHRLNASAVAVYQLLRRPPHLRPTGGGSISMGWADWLGEGGSRMSPSTSSSAISISSGLPRRSVEPDSARPESSASELGP